MIKLKVQCQADILFNRSSLHQTARLDYIPLLPSLMTSVEQFFD